MSKYKWKNKRKYIEPKRVLIKALEVLCDIVAPTADHYSNGCIRELVPTSAGFTGTFIPDKSSSEILLRQKEPFNMICETITNSGKQFKIFVSDAEITPGRDDVSEDDYYCFIAKSIKTQLLQ